MPDFLDRFGDQLRTAQAASIATPPGHHARRMSRRRAWIVVIVVLAVAAPAVAVTRPWEPLLGRPAVDGGAPRASRAPVTAIARDSLSVLRRPQTEADRRLAQPLLRALNPRTEGVQVAGIRALRSGYALIPVKSVEIAPGRRIEDALCLSDGASLGCHPAKRVPDTGIGMLSATKTQTRLWGVVPDGVARVRFEPVGHPPVETGVESNFFALRVNALAPARRVPAPEGYPGPATIPGPPTPVEAVIRWLDDAGRIVGPRAE
jgi:hypothetical protein